ncbi:MAG: hypothetical protein GX781_06425 [Clostridiales bacterium]|nr:hypothetical protein [Clostridiales bacterium]
MRAKQFLTSVKDSNDQIGKLIRLQGILSGMPASKRLQEHQKQTKALEAQIHQAYEINRMTRRRVQNFIDRLPDAEERQILKLLYLSLMRMEDAARVMGYCPRQCYRIQQRALMHLEGMRF